MTAAWPAVALGEVARFIRGVTFKPGQVSVLGDQGSIACLRTSNVQVRLDLGDVWAIPEALVPRAEQRLRFGDTLISSANSWNLVGKCSWVGELPWPATFGGFVTTMRPRSQAVDARYLYRWFSWQRTQETLRSFGRRTTNISNLSLERCRNMPIPLPPIEEQRRIAAVLDEADELRAKRRASLALLDTLTESIFFDMFGRSAQTPVTVGLRLDDHPLGWRWEALTDVARLATGHTPDRDNPSYWHGDVPWISLTEIRELDGRVASDTVLRVTPLGINHSSSVLLPTGTVCLSRTASIGFVTIMGRPMATSQDFVNWVCGEQLRPAYLMHAFLRSRRRLRSLSTGSTHKTIYMRVAEQFRVLLPPIELQETFESRIEEVGVAGRHNSGALAQLDQLFAALQHRAFAGEL